MSTVPGLDVIIVAGGRAKRMGGVDKAAVTVNGERLIDHLLDEVSVLDALQQVIVVSSRDLQVRPGVKLTAEEPAFSGPVAAIYAGAAALHERAAERTAILAVDAPESANLIPELTEALDESGAEAAVIREESGHLQPLCAVWHTESLWLAINELGETADRPVKALLEQANSVTEVAGTGEERDYDTLHELADFGEVDLP